MTGTPARRYSWPPFEPGNLAAAKHGAYSDRLVAPLVDGTRVGLESATPFTQRPELLDRMAQTKARLAVLDTYLAEHGALDDKGKPRPAADFAIRLERLWLDQWRTFVKLSLDIATATRDGDLDALAEEGRRIREARRS